jgi:hypothetical protein
MCDFSLMHAKSRPAKVGDRLVTRSFGTGTTGFADVDAIDTAVCLLPGTEIAFDGPPSVYLDYSVDTRKGPMQSSVAIFRQINREQARAHHDALEFPPDGETILLTYLETGQRAVVLQLPAQPKTEEEAKEQSRLEVVG